jgi:periplasmic copper chaperone A
VKNHKQWNRAAYLVNGLLVASLALASLGARAGAPEVLRPWLRATAPGTTVGVAYFEIQGGEAADELVAIATPAAGRVEIHSSAMVGGMMQMRELKSVPIPAGGTVKFAPNGLHAMLLELKAPLVEGGIVELTLRFRGGATRTVRAPVEGLGAMTGPAAATGSHEAHH